MSRHRLPLPLGAEFELRLRPELLLRPELRLWAELRLRPELRLRKPVKRAATGRSALERRASDPLGVQSPGLRLGARGKASSTASWMSHSSIAASGLFPALAISKRSRATPSSVPI